MCSKQRSFEPTHVFANLSPRILTSNDEGQSGNQKRRVEVSGTAEFTLSPDQAVLTVVISNKKESAIEAKTSVMRRLDYIVQTLINHGLQKSHIEVTQNLSRPGGKGWFYMEAQVDAVFDSDLQKCLNLSNLFVEKLDNCVKILPPVLRHDKQHLESVRKQTCLTALANARQKALEVCRLLGQSLGRPVYVTENIVREWKGQGSSATDEPPAGCETAMPTVDEVTCKGPIDVQRRMQEQSITVRVDVTATFEIRGKLEKVKK